MQGAGTVVGGGRMGKHRTSRARAVVHAKGTVLSAREDIQPGPSVCADTRPMFATRWNVSVCAGFATFGEGGADRGGREPGGPGACKGVEQTGAPGAGSGNHELRVTE